MPLLVEGQLKKAYFSHGYTFLEGEKTEVEFEDFVERFEVVMIRSIENTSNTAEWVYYK